ncbi:MAG: O-antigen ligase family protein [bacterium]|nr:O-antigen ligase family protein [bacterium]
MERRLNDHSPAGLAQYRSQFERMCFLIVEYGSYLAMLTPFILLREYFFPFVSPKTIFFRIIVDIIFVAYVLLVISNRKYLPKINPLNIALTLFLFVAVFTSLTGVNFARSFWSVFERMTGLLTLLHLFVFFIILTSVFKEKKYWERILVVSIMVGVLVVLYAWTSTEESTRGGSTIGNTSFMSGYMLFNIFFAIILLFTKNIWWKIFCATTASVLIASLFISIEPTQGAIGAFLISASFLGLSYLLFYLFSSGRKKFKIVGFLLIGLFIIGLLIVLQLNFFQQWVVNTWYGGSIQSRLVIWKMAYQGWQERFWLGWGQENFNIPFAKYFDPQLPLSGDIWYDRAHNIIFDTLITSGILGLISYLSIFGVAIFGLLRIIPKITERKNLLYPLGMTSLLLAYFIQDFFVFDMISSYMMFFLSLAFISFLISSPKEEIEIPSRIRNPIYLFIGGFLIILSILTLYLGNIRPALASRYIIFGLVYPLEQSIPFFQKALNVSPVAQFEVPEQLAIRLAGFSSQPVKDPKILDEGFKLAGEALKKSISNSPLDFRLQLFLGRYYNNFYQFTGKTENLSLAEETFKKAVALSPKNQQAYWSIGQTLLFEGRRDEAIQYFQKAVDLEPRWGASYWYLVLTYKLNKQYDLAAAAAIKAEENGYKWRDNAENLKNVIDIYKALEDFNMLKPLYERAVELSPKDVMLWSNLADIYAAFGEREKAKEAADKILELDPSKAPEIEQFLKQLGY